MDLQKLKYLIVFLELAANAKRGVRLYITRFAIVENNAKVAIRINDGLT